MLRARGISRAFGGQTVLDGVSLALDGRDRVGVVGPNGVGKTTLLRVLAGLEAPDGGTVERAPRQLTVGYLPQEPDAGAGETLLGYLARRTGVAGRLRRARPAHRRPVRGPGQPRRLRRCARPLPGPRRRRPRGPGRGGRAPRSGWRRRPGDPARAGFAQPVATLSGGEAARAALAAILLSRVDVLLLDEPTNNLDFAGLDLLEGFVDGFGGAVLVVSHDRAFLDRCVHRIVELDEPHPPGPRVRRRLDGLHRGPRPGPLPAVRGPRALRGRARPPARAPAHPDAVDRAGVRAGQDLGRARQEPPGRQERAQREAGRQGEGHRAQAGPARDGRQALGGLAPAAQPGRRRPQRRRGGPPRPGCRRAVARRPGRPGRRLPPGPDRPGGGLAGPAGHPRPQRLGQDDPVAGPARARSRWRRAVAGSGPGVADRGDGPAPRPVRRRRAGAGAPSRPSPAWPSSESRSLLAKFGLGADHVGRAGHDLSPGERSRALLGALMADRGQLPGPRRAHQPPRHRGHRAARAGPGRHSTAPCCSCPTTAASSSPSTSPAPSSCRQLPGLRRPGVGPTPSRGWTIDGQSGSSPPPLAAAAFGAPRSRPGPRRAPSATRAGHGPDVGGPGLALASLDGLGQHPGLADAGALGDAAGRGDDGREAGGGRLQRPTPGLDGPQPRRRHLLALQDVEPVRRAVGRVQQHLAAVG